MPRLSRRISPICALLLGAFLFTGCPGGGGGGGGDGGNGGQDAGPPGDAMMDTTEDDETMGGGSCDSSDDCESEDAPVCNEETGECVECVSDSDCVGQNQVCGDNNTCELEAADQCEQVGDTCTPGEPTSDGFLCVDDGLGDPTCMAQCGGDFGQCPASKVCLAGEQAQGGEARSVCYPSQCEGPHDTETCQDASGHVLFGDYPNGAKCATIGGANLCVPDGSQDSGSKCNATFPALCAAQDIPEEDCFTCSAGNVCQDGKCRTACGSEGSCSSGDDSCIGLGSDQIAGTSGFCGQECDAFSRGQCGSDQGCAPLNGETGYCGDVGDKGFMESCEPGGIANPDTRSCKEGMRCLQMQGEPGGENAIARCIPQCNPTNDSQTQNDVTCGGSAYAKFVYTSDAPSAVDVYVDGTAVVTDLQSGSVSDADGGTDGAQFTELDVGTDVDVKIVDSSNDNADDPELTLTETFTSGTVETYVISASGESNITSQTFPVPGRAPAPSEGGVMVRVAHAVQGITDDNDNPQPVDIVAAAPDASPSEGTELATGASMGDVTAFAEVPSGTYDVYVFPEGTDRTEANALTTLTEVDVSGDAPQTFYVYGSASGTISAQAVGYLEPPSAPDFSCQALTQDPGPTGGFCFDECSPGDYGQGSCPGTDNACQPLIDSHFCTPTEGTEQGSSCTPSDSAFVTACEEGSYCEEFGDGSGQCRSRCIKGDSSNGTLTCGDSTTCNAPSEGDFGQCQISCTPGSEASDSESCPENLQSCFPTTTSEGSAQRAFCSASGSKAEGEECGGSGPGLLQQNCEAGLICSYSESTGTSFTGMTSRQEDAENPPTCRQRCQPFASDSGCPDGQSCWPDFAVTGGSDATGVCMASQEVQSKSTGIPCDNPGQLCGDASMCVTLQGDNFCYELCDPDASENTCSEPQDTTRNCRRVTNGAVGQCLPPQN